MRMAGRLATLLDGSPKKRSREHKLNLIAWDQWFDDLHRVQSPAYPSIRPHAPPSPGTGGTVSVADPGVGWPASRESRMSDVHDILFEW